MATNASSFFSRGQHEVGHFSSELNTVCKTDKWSHDLRKTTLFFQDDINNLGSGENKLNVTSYNWKIKEVICWICDLCKKKKKNLCWEKKTSRLA